MSEHYRPDDIDTTPDELFARMLVNNLWRDDPDLARRLEPGPASDRQPQRSPEDAFGDVVKQIRKEIDG